MSRICSVGPLNDIFFLLLVLIDWWRLWRLSFSSTDRQRLSCRKVFFYFLLFFPLFSASPGMLILLIHVFFLPAKRMYKFLLSSISTMFSSSYSTFFFPFVRTSAFAPRPDNFSVRSACAFDYCTLKENNVVCSLSLSLPLLIRKVRKINSFCFKSANAEMMKSFCICDGIVDSSMFAYWVLPLSLFTHLD